MDRRVIDASVALKWVLDEDGTPAALQMLDAGALHAPDFVFVEIGNVLWAKVRRRRMSRTAADSAYDSITAVGLTLTPLAELIAPARRLAFALDLTVYDTLYAALAQQLDCPLATADRALADAMNAAGMPGSAFFIE